MYVVINMVIIRSNHQEDYINHKEGFGFMISSPVRSMRRYRVGLNNMDICIVLYF